LTLEPGQSAAARPGVEPGSGRSRQIASVGGHPGRPTTVLDDLVDQCNRPIDLTGDAPDALAASARAEGTADLARIGARLGMPVIQESDSTVAFSSVKGGNVLMQSAAIEGGLCSFSPCNITLFANAWQGQSAITPALHVLLTHEVVHCYQKVA